MPSLDFAGRAFHVVGGRALFWPRYQALILADLHLEKGSWFAVRGQMLPPHDTVMTLERIAALVGETGAVRVWCLGDNFHDSTGPGRMTDDARALLARLTGAVEWLWVTGNHDEQLPPGVGGRIVIEAEVGGLVLRHEANARELRPELSGHFHPKFRAAGRGGSVSRPCFVASDRKLIFPAFGALAGGLAADHPAILAAAGEGAAACVPTAERVLCFPLTRQRRERRFIGR
jgi:uncharacterized protein